MNKLSRRRIAKQVVSRIEDGDLTISRAAKLLAAYLITERRTNEVHLLLNDLASELESRGTTTINVVSAHKLTDQINRELKDLFKKQTGASHAELEAELDPALLGGLRASSANLEVDLSVKGRLNALKAQL